MPEKKKESSTSPYQATANFGIQLTGEAKGSQPVLLVFSLLSFLLLIGGIASILLTRILGLAAAVAGILSMLLGIWVIRMVHQMWTTAQPTVDSDKELPIQGTISISENQLSLSGTDRMVFANDNKALIITLVERLFLQKQLPPAAGEVIGSPADPISIREYSQTELEEEHAIECDRLQASKDALKHQLSSVNNLVASLPAGALEEKDVSDSDAAVHLVAPNSAFNIRATK